MEFKEGESLAIVHFGELWLKGRNRRSYISALRRNILKRLDGLGAEFYDLHDRFALRPKKGYDLPEIASRLGHVFGISTYGTAYAARPTLQSIRKISKIAMKGMHAPLRIEARRSYKGTGFTSPDIEKLLCDAAEKSDILLSRRAPASTLYVSLMRDNAFVYTERRKVLGGLPVGTSGKGIILLSGGIDSPVAAWYAMKRGILPVYLHIHAYKSHEEAAGSKIGRILNVLNGYSAGARVYYTPSYIFDAAAIGTGRYQLILLKSFMLTTAERIAKKEGANLIFTGESIGQVASQTAPNLLAESYGVKIPVIRPLAGFDKEEIIRKAKEIGTYEYSLLPYRDVCSINMKHPKTEARYEKIAELRKEIHMNRIVGRSIKSSAVYEAGSNMRLTDDS